MTVKELIKREDTAAIIGELSKRGGNDYQEKLNRDLEIAAYAICDIGKILWTIQIYKMTVEKELDEDVVSIFIKMLETAQVLLEDKHLAYIGKMMDDLDKAMDVDSAVGMVKELNTYMDSLLKDQKK